MGCSWTFIRGTFRSAPRQRSRGSASASAVPGCIDSVDRVLMRVRRVRVAGGAPPPPVGHGQSFAVAVNPIDRMSVRFLKSTSKVEQGPDMSSSSLWLILVATGRRPVMPMLVPMEFGVDIGRPRGRILQGRRRSRRIRSLFGRRIAEIRFVRTGQAGLGASRRLLSRQQHELSALGL